MYTVTCIIVFPTISRRLASHSLFSDWTGAGEKGLVTLGYSLCKSGMLLNINVTCKFILMRQSRVKAKDKYTDLSSQPFEILVPQCLLCHNLWISMEQLMNVEILAVLL